MILISNPVSDLADIAVLRVRGYTSLIANGLFGLRNVVN